jgi:hypothetical protein
MYPALFIKCSIDCRGLFFTSKACSSAVSSVLRWYATVLKQFMNTMPRKRKSSARQFWERHYSSLAPEGTTHYVESHELGLYHR